MTTPQNEPPQNEPPPIGPNPPELLYIKLPDNVRFEANHRPMTKIEIAFLFLTYTHYACGVRWLTGEETRDIMRAKYCGVEYRTPDAAFKRFDNRNDPATDALLKIRLEDMRIFLEIIDLWFRYLCRIDPAFGKRADFLSGL